jgi:hypothetical protein
MNESDLKSCFVEHFTKDFTVIDEVPGRFLVDGSKVAIDYFLYPKPDLIAKGFVAEWFGVEVKSPDREGAKKGLRVAWPAITYRQSEFEDHRIGQDKIRPAFVLIYPPLANFLGSQREAYYIVCLLQKANVGYVEIDAQKGRWHIRFGANSYFHSERSLSKTLNVSTKRNVGSWK